MVSTSDKIHIIKCKENKIKRKSVIIMMNVLKVMNVKDLKEVIEMIQERTDLIINVAENEDELLNIYLYDNVINVEVLDIDNYLTVNSFEVDSFSELKEMIVEVYDLEN